MILSKEMKMKKKDDDGRKKGRKGPKKIIIKGMK